LDFQEIMIILLIYFFKLKILNNYGNMLNK